MCQPPTKTQEGSTSLLLEGQSVSTIEDVYEYLGGMGRYHVYLVLLLGMAGVPMAISTYMVMFTEKLPDHFCNNSFLVSQNFTKHEIKNLTVPKHFEPECQVTTFENCQAYLIDEEIFQADPNQPEKSVIFNQTQACSEGYLYDTSFYQTTVYSDFNLACSAESQFLKNLSISATYLGMVAGNLIAGFVLDNFGRNRVISAAYASGCGLMLACSYATNFYFYLICRILALACFVLAYVGGFTYTLEVVNKKFRAWSSFSTPTLFILGIFIATAGSYLVREWRALNTYLSLLPLVILPFLYLLPESPAYTLCQGDLTSTAKICQFYAAKNGHTHHTVENLEAMLQNVKIVQQEQKYTTIDLFRHGKHMTLVNLKLMVLWIGVAIVYYGLALDTRFLPFSIYQSLAFYGIIDLISNFCFPALVNCRFLGRKWTAIYSYLIMGSCCILASLLSNHYPCQHKIEIGEISKNYQLFLKYSILFLSLLGRFMATGTFSLIYTYHGELSPTPIRGNAVGFGNMVSKLGTASIPVCMQIFDSIYPGGARIFYGSVCLLGGYLAVYLPETLDIGILNNFDDAIQLYKSV